MHADIDIFSSLSFIFAIYCRAAASAASLIGQYFSLMLSHCDYSHYADAIIFATATRAEPLFLITATGPLQAAA